MRHAVNIGSCTHRTVVIIADNRLHHQRRSIIAAITDRGQCQQRRQNLLVLPLATLHNSKQKIQV
jgi:hypothetical protein